MNYLKSILIALIFSFTIGTVSSQHLDFQFGAGVGSSYLIEVWKGGTNMNYYASQSYSAALRLTPDSSYFNLKILFQHVSTNFTESSINFNRYGEITSFTSFIIAEHLNTNKKFNLGYDFGGGYSVENINYDGGGLISGDETRKFVSIRIGMLASLRTGNRSRLSLEPSLFWTDIANSFVQRNWKAAAEDASFLVNLTYTYRLTTVFKPLVENRRKNHTTN